jgi:general secretion pathway protein L
MSQWLYLSPVTEDAAPQCCWWQADGPLHKGDLHQAAHALNQQALTLLLPMEMASYHRVSVPPRSGRWLQQALSNAVEEQLIDELDNLHLAHGPLKDKSHCSLIAINRHTLNRCLDQLAAVNLRPSRIHIDADCLPTDKPRALAWDNRWLIGGDTPIRLALAQTELEGLHTLLPADLHWQSATAPDVSSSVDIDWQANERPWDTLSQGSVHAINLCQGEFQRRMPQTPAWRFVALALVIAVFAHVLQNVALSTYLNQQSDQIQAQTATLWLQRFPEAGPVGDPGAYIRSQQQPENDHYNGVALRLSQLSNQWSNSHGALAQVQRLAFQAGEGWTLQVNAPAFSDLQQLREGLIDQGLDASTDSSVRDTQGVSARFQIKE